MSARAIPVGRIARGSLTPPPSKSLSNRYLNLALLAGRPLRIRRLLEAEDTEVFLAALERLGWNRRPLGPLTELAPVGEVREAEVWCGASGTMARFLTASLAALPGRWHLDGSPRLRERPLTPLLEALRALGATVLCRGAEGFLPLEIRGGGLGGGAVRLDASRSSQFASALLMAASRARGPVTVELEGLVSDPYLELTCEALRSFGGTLQRRGERGYRIGPGLPGRYDVTVDGDDSSAAYWAAAALLTGGELELRGLAADSAQGDRRFLDVLTAMGLRTEWRSDVLRVAAGGPLRAVDRDFSEMPDQVPTLAVLAPFAAGVTRIRNVPHLRLKESDRLAGVAAGLTVAGARVEEHPDGLVIPGIWAEAAPPEEPVTLDPVDDHRLAMSFAILGCRRPGLSVSDAAVVAKSYPGFWRDLDLCFRP